MDSLCNSNVPLLCCDLNCRKILAFSFGSCLIVYSILLGVKEELGFFLSSRSIVLNTLAASAKPCASRTSAQVWGGFDVVTSLSPLPRVSLASVIWRLRRVSEGLTLDYG